MQVQTTLDMFDSLLAQHRDVAQRSKTLYSSCEQIVKEKEQLEEFADALRAKLRWVGGWVGEGRLLELDEGSIMRRGPS